MDLKSTNLPSDWLVIGWFTEDATYRSLAEAFATNLAQHSTPYHLFARRKPEGADWHELIRMKPTILLEAMDTYPSKTLVLMDVDCVVRGDISSMVDIRSDVGITLYVGDVPMQKDLKWKLEIGFSSRVIVLRPTDGTRMFLRAWIDAIGCGHNEENSAARAVLASLGATSFSYVDDKYSGRETGQIDGAVIEHNSIHDEARRRASHGPIKKWLRNFERRYFRTGRTQRSKRKTEIWITLQNALGYFPILSAHKPPKSLRVVDLITRSHRAPSCLRRCCRTRTET